MYISVTAESTARGSVSRACFSTYDCVKCGGNSIERCMLVLVAGGANTSPASGEPGSQTENGGGGSRAGHRAEGGGRGEGMARGLATGERYDGAAATQCGTHIAPRYAPCMRSGGLRSAAGQAGASSSCILTEKATALLAPRAASARARDAVHASCALHTVRPLYSCGCPVASSPEAAQCQRHRPPHTRLPPASSTSTRLRLSLTMRILAI